MAFLPASVRHQHPDMLHESQHADDDRSYPLHRSVDEAVDAAGQIEQAAERDRSAHGTGPPELRYLYRRSGEVCDAVRVVDDGGHGMMRLERNTQPVRNELK